jgi:predicted nucleic acid-binding protein
MAVRAAISAGSHAFAARLARETGLTACEASYLWIALAEDAELVTLDAELARAAARRRP